MEFGVTSVYDEITQEYMAVEPDEMLFPALSVCPMGFSWSLYFCHSVLEQAMIISESERTGQPRQELEKFVLRDRKRRPRLSHTNAVIAPYVDNAIFCVHLLSKPKRLSIL